MATAEPKRRAFCLSMTEIAYYRSFESVVASNIHLEQCQLRDLQFESKNRKSRDCRQARKIALRPEYRYYRIGSLKPCKSIPSLLK